MEIAIAAVQTGNISQRGAAKRFGVNRETLRLALNEGGVVTKICHGTTQSEEPPTKPRVADNSERDQWFADHQAGLSARKIAEKYKRSRLAITKEIKRRKGVEAQPEPTPTPSVPSAGSSTAEAQEAVTPTGKLNESMEVIVKRERLNGQLRLKAVAELSKLKKELEKTWTTAQRERQKAGASIHAKNVEIAEKQLQRDGAVGIFESLTQIAEEAEAVKKAARQALYHFMFVDLP